MGAVDGLPGLERAAAALAPAQTGLVALDWWNGNRSVLADADLSGVVAGLTLTTTAVDIYRSLLESIAFGNKAVLDNFRDGGLELNEVVACGGIAEKSPLLMQMLADVCGLTVDGAGVVPGAGAGFGPIWRRGCRPGSGRVRRYLRRGQGSAPADRLDLYSRTEGNRRLRRGLQDLEGLT